MIILISEIFPKAQIANLKPDRELTHNCHWWLILSTRLILSIQLILQDDWDFNTFDTFDDSDDSDDRDDSEFWWLWCMTIYLVCMYLPATNSANLEGDVSRLVIFQASHFGLLQYSRKSCKALVVSSWLWSMNSCSVNNLGFSF